jgi:hypothetical protein
MKKTILSLTLIAGIALVSCNKENVEENFTTEASGETETLRLPESGYNMTVTETLTKSSGDAYTSGIIEYTKNGNVLATFNYGSGDEDDKANYVKDGKKYDCKLDGKGKGKKKFKKKFKKVIIEPIVKSDDCQYIVSGIIKYYDYKSGDWLATVNYGDGTCDDIAVKTTKEGDYAFSLSK